MWTPFERDAFIKHAITSEASSGRRNGYRFKVMDKEITQKRTDPPVIEGDRPVRPSPTAILAQAIFASDPAFRRISLDFYAILVDRLRCHAYLRRNRHFEDDVRVVCKGGLAYSYHSADRETFPHSDMDIAVYVNPRLSKDLFTRIHGHVSTVVAQTVSLYKRRLDAGDLVPRPLFDAFVATLRTLCDTSEPNPDQTPPKNGRSKGGVWGTAGGSPSYTYRDSEAQPGKVCRVEIPHFDKCECIPLRRSALFASSNLSIAFDRDDAGTYRGHFDLYRLRMGMGFVDRRLTNADFIDVCVPHADDAELVDFWRVCVCVLVKDEATGVTLMVPDMPSCVHDLDKMLHVYSSRDGKRERRMRQWIGLDKHLLLHVQ